MIKILIYNNQTNRMETYFKDENDAMPYNNGTLKVKEFRGASKSNFLWTDRRTMQSWNNFRTMYGRPIFFFFSFRRCWEGGHSNLSHD